jgi:hypothetical protein
LRAGKPRLIGKYANGPILRAIAWAMAGAAILATALLLGATALGM